MGSSQSARRVTIHNESSLNVVKVSESVSKRLRGEEDSVKENRPESTTKNPLKNAKAKKSTEAEKHLRTRIEKLEKLNDQLYKTAVNKYKTCLSSLEKEFVDQTYAPVCQVEEQNVINCYNQNPTTSLNCSQEVQQFKNCVGKVRVASLKAG